MNVKVQKNSIKGITLISLVITIVVLIILAGVSIATLTGENGIITKANEAKQKNEEASIEEQKRPAQIEASMNTIETTYNGVKIPAYCAPTRIDGESTIDEGLCIIDKNGNEWVWIEVPTSIYTNTEYNGGTAPTSSEDYAKIESVMQKYAESYRQEGWTDTFYSTEQHGFKDAEEYNALKNKMLKSVYENGGFYIGKYEVGSFDNPVTSNDNTRKPVIQQGAFPYNWVTCKQAQELSKNLSIGGKTSSLMFGIQWDLVLTHLEESGVSENNLKVNSNLWGNYNDVKFDIFSGKYTTNNGVSYTDVNGIYSKPVSGALLTTGVTERNSKMNLYDLAGNLWELTLEKSTSVNDPCTVNGGAYSCNGTYGAISNQYSHSTTSSNDSIGFRPALY